MHTLKLLSLFSILIFCTFSFSQGTWEWQNPLPQGDGLVKILPISENMVVASGYNGTIIITNDGGVNWHVQNLPGNSSIRSISFLDSLNGWVINKEKVFKTQNGAMLWEENEPNIDKKSSILKDIIFINNSVGWLLADCGIQAYYDDPNNYSGKLYSTTDGGNIWSEIPIAAKSRFLKMLFPDSSTGFILTEELSGYFIFRKKNSGEMWEKLETPILINADPEAVFFASSKIGWFGRYKTVDGGITWELYADTVPSEYFIKNIYFYNDFIGWMIARYSTYQPELGYWVDHWVILKTNDGGKKWTIQKDDIPELLHDINFLNSRFGWICGERGALYKTINSGEEWIRITQGTSQTLKDIDFVDDNYGWAVGAEGTILYTINSGKKWALQESQIINYLYAVDFIDRYNGWAVGDEVILNTTNGGDYWQVQYNKSQTVLRDVHFVDNLNGWAIGFNGIILRTNNSGISWEQQNSNTTEKLGAIFFLDKNHGWACGSNGVILSTKDGGLKWHGNYLPTLGFLRALQFVDKNNGWCSDGDFNNFYTTNDGGESWIAVPYDNYIFDIKGIQSFYFLDSNIGWAGGFLGGDIAKTADGGWTWKLQERLISSSIEKIYFHDINLGWCISRNAILRYTRNDTTQNNTDINNYQLTRIYPNPFNRFTTIYFYIPKAQKVNIHVFDILGRHIKAIYEGWAEQGVNTKKWNTTDLPSGLYIIRFTCQDYIQSIRGIIVK